MDAIKKAERAMNALKEELSNLERLVDMLSKENDAKTKQIKVIVLFGLGGGGPLS